MFGMGFTEIFLIAVVAIIALGPEKLPSAMVDIAKMFRKLKSQVSDAKHTIEEEMKVSELKEGALEYKKQLDDTISDVKEMGTLDIDDIVEEFEGIQESVKVSESTPKMKHPKNRYVDETPPMKRPEPKPELEQESKDTNV
jgi:sec-independent protein translocase protein TatB